MINPKYLARKLDENYSRKNASQAIVLLIALTTYGCTPAATFSKMPATGADLTSSLKTFQPALAVRGAACLFCHAVITGNVISDFAYGETYFMGSTNSSTPAATFVDAAGENWYGNPVNTWQSATITGQVFIPIAESPYEVRRGAHVSSYYDSGSVTLFPAGTSLFNIMSTPYQTGDSPTDAYNQDLTNQRIGPLPAPFPRTNMAMDAGVRLPSAAPSTSPTLVAKSNILIRAPSTVEIQGLAAAARLSTFQTGVGQLSAPPVGKTTNLMVAGTAPNQVITQPSSGNLVCYGDVVVNGPLLLNQPVIDTDSNGCRIYSTGSVFIRGPIQYLNANNNSNLQISSSRAILMGVFFNPDTSSSNYSIYSARLSVASSRDAQVRANLPDYTDLFGTTPTPSNQIAVDGLLGRIYNDALAVFNTFGDLPDGAEFDGSSPQGITMNHLLLNAPIIQSRYLGSITGTIISELAIFRLGSFVYFYDDLFSSTPALPALPTKIFSVSDD